jgi:inner membrane protein
MASIFGHALTAVAIGKSFSKNTTNWRFWLLGIGCAILPDADVIGFSFGIKYSSFWGHRGFSHSILFAIFFGVLITFIFYKKQFASKKGLLLMLFFFLCTASHGVLDAMTTGGLGVAFFSPFNDARHFFSWRPIKVSPIGIERFFSQRGFNVIKSELIWIAIPSLIFIFSAFFVRRINLKEKPKE